MGGDPLSNIASPPRLEERERKKMKLDDFLKRAENLQLEEKGRTLPIMQIAIMFETWSAGDSVPMSNIIKKYEVPIYTVSRNCKMLSDGILDSNVNKGKRAGKNWINVEREGKFRHINFTVAGKKIADRLFA
jgi:hypothetical protein